MEEKNLENELNSHSKTTSSNKRMGLIIGLILVGISVFYRQYSSHRRIEYENQLLNKQYQEQKLRIDMKMKKYIDDSMERYREERARKREEQIFKSLREGKVYK